GTAPISYTWDFGDGHTSGVEDPVHVYDAGGCYTVTLTATNTCGTDVWSEQICVCDPVAIADVTYATSDLQVTFDATVSGTAPISYTWDFGDMGTSTEEDPVHVYAAGGCYTVTLIVQNGCGTDTWTEQICVCDPVSGLDFTWLPAVPTAGVEVSFAATADGTLPITFDWDFGDGHTATGQNPTHTFTAAGDYLVEVTATNCDGTSATKSYTVTVEAARRYYYLPIVAKD
ncbi:MAG: PKD domain-containing protein, partial [Anaerolineae bacterium]|nr:PKD domain-containing protein [Anaerolineae bacterium]